MTYTLLIASVVCAWATLSLLGGERQRQLWQLECDRKRAQRDATAGAANAAAPGGRPPARH